MKHTRPVLAAVLAVALLALPTLASGAAVPTSLQMTVLRTK